MASQRVRYNWASNICGRVRSTLSTKKLFAGVLDRSENWISLVHSFGKDKIFGYLLGYSGLSWWLRWERLCPQSRRPRFDPSVGKISWRREWQPNPVFLPWKIPWTEESGRLQPIESHRVGHNWRDWAHIYTYIIFLYCVYVCLCACVDAHTM